MLADLPSHEGGWLGEAQYIDLMPHNRLAPFCTAADDPNGGGSA